MAFSQTREAYGPVLPMIYDAQGGRHYCLYGYYGPLDPPIAASGGDDTIVCRSGSSFAPWLLHGRLNSAQARAQAPK
jgi:hypothetical protein